jgi:uncharacterized protein (TIGR02594 family)
MGGGEDKQGTSPSTSEIASQEPKSIEDFEPESEGADEESDESDDDGADGDSARTKPWWAIILVAALTAFGAQLTTSTLKLIGQEIDSIRPKSIQLNFLVLQKVGSGPLTGVDIVLRDPDGQNAIASGKTNEHGALARNVSLRYGAYLLELRYKLAATEYARSEQIVISKQFYAEKLEFDPNEWQEITTLASNAISSTTASAVLSSDLPPVTQGPPWLGTAFRELGQHEYPAPHVNPRILEYWTAIPGFPLPEDPQRVDWASAFVGWVLKQNGIAGTQSATSRSWLNWGKVVETPRPGCVAVFWTQSPTSPTGHVGFFVSSNADSVTVLGGDTILPDPHGVVQRQVALKRMRRASFLGCREP